MVKKTVSSLPEWSKKPLRLTRDFVYSIPYRGKGCICPICNKSMRKFRKLGICPDDACCIHCCSLGRHRFVWLYFNKMTNLFDGRFKKMLHIAPEPCLESRLKKCLGESYITADLLNPRVMVKMDITEIQYPEEFFDVIYCSHVLEHVQNDKKALKEFHRILKDDGWAIILVPITVNRTFEDYSIIDPSERRRVFGQEDHVRRYGSDYIDRLQEAGFRVKVSYVSDFFKKEDIVHMGLTPGSGEIYYCSKG